MVMSLHTIFIVLGCSDEKTSRKRVDRAIFEFRKKPPEEYVDFAGVNVIRQKFLFSGGNPYTHIPEAIQMKRYAIDCGINEKYILTETESKNTIENFIFSNKIIEPTKNFISKICICTSSFHLPRVKVISHFILKGYFLEFIHTHEEVSSIQKERENQALLKFVHNYK